MSPVSHRPEAGVAGACHGAEHEQKKACSAKIVENGKINDEYLQIIEKFVEYTDTYDIEYIKSYILI
jgi:hypothetical protein